jgi:hypothetical protein
VNQAKFGSALLRMRMMHDERSEALAEGNETSCINTLLVIQEGPGGGGGHPTVSFTHLEKYARGPSSAVGGAERGPCCAAARQRTCAPGPAPRVQRDAHVLQCTG